MFDIINIVLLLIVQAAFRRQNYLLESEMVLALFVTYVCNLLWPMSIITAFIFWGIWFLFYFALDKIYDTKATHRKDNS